MTFRYIQLTQYQPLIYGRHLGTHIKHNANILFIAEIQVKNASIMPAFYLQQTFTLHTASLLFILLQTFIYIQPAQYQHLIYSRQHLFTYSPHSTSILCIADSIYVIYSQPVIYTSADIYIHTTSIVPDFDLQQTFMYIQPTQYQHSRHLGTPSRNINVVSFLTRVSSSIR